MERRLAAILAADVVGYSRLIGADEEGTLRTLRAYREVIDGLVAAHHGRIFGTAGDSVIAEFASPVEAVRCAAEVQQKLGNRNADVPEDRRMEFRIGVNLGDVVVEGDDLLGDGVNVAARLQELADPGGICISRAARDQVRDKLDVVLDDMGEVEVKNIARPVRVFRVGWDGETPGRPVVAMRPTSRRWAAVVAIVVAFAGTAAVVAWFRPWAPDIEPASVERMAFPLPDKPSIAVLPFNNMSGDPSQDYFADGMTEDIITDLSKVSGLFVIARNSSFSYKGQRVKVRQVAEELGVRYVLEGSVRRAGDEVRINAQLIDAATGGHLWADRYDGTAGDVFALQDRVTARVVESLALVLTKTEAAAAEARETDFPAAHDAFLQGLSHMRQRSPEDFAEARRWIDKALLIDPTYPRALGARAALYLAATRLGWDAAVGIEGRADAIAATYAALKHPSALAHAIEADLLLSRPDTIAARKAVDRGLALDPNDPDLHIIAAVVEAGLGNHERAVELANRSLRLDPRYPPRYLESFGIVRRVAGETDAALALLDRALDRDPNDWNARIRRAAALAELGRIEDAVAELEIARKNWPSSWGARQFTAPVLAWYWGRSFGEAYVERLTTAFLATGLPHVPEGIDVQEENRLDLAAHEALLGGGARLIGRCCGGEWMTDQHADGSRVEYWNGEKTGTSTRSFHANGSIEIRRDDRLVQNSYCQPYRNPGGSNEKLDAYLAVCANGVYPFGVFPLP